MASSAGLNEKSTLILPALPSRRQQPSIPGVGAAPLILENAAVEGTLRLQSDLLAVPGERNLRILALAGESRNSRTVTVTVVPPSSGTPITSKTGLRLVYVPAGSGVMGTDRSEDSSAAEDETPRHTIHITRPLFVSVTEITVAEQKGEKRTWKNAVTNQGDDHPVTMVSWKDAMAFCVWVSKKEGKPFDLPTEAEWEYICRAGRRDRWHTGSSLSSSDAVFETSTPTSGGNRSSNSWGLYDMHGNVWEWCKDGKRAYVKGRFRDPQGSADGPRVMRGGSWREKIERTRCSARFDADPGFHADHVGFRVVQRVGDSAGGK